MKSLARALPLVLGAFTTAFAAGQAHATDWVVNMNDTGSDPVPAGGTIVYDIDVANADLASATSPPNTIILLVPANSRFLGGTGSITDCAPSPAPGPVTVACRVPPLAGGAAARLSARLLAEAAAVTDGGLTLAVEVPTLGVDRQPRNNAVQESTTVVEGADIRLGLTGPDRPVSGSTVSYVYTATNLGPFPARNVVVSVPVQPGLTGIVPPASCTLSGGTYTCTIPGPIAVGASASLTFGAQVSAAASSTLTVTGSVTGSTPQDPIPDNNSAKTETTVTPGADLRITKARSPSGALQLGDRVTFTLTASYTGSEPLDITITDPLPAIYTVVDVTSSGGWSCSVAGRQVTCRKPAGSGAGVNIPLGTITIAADVTGTGTNQQNTASIIASPETPDPNLANNRATDTPVTVEDAKADLVAFKTGPATVVTGDSFSYSIRTFNSGNQAFTGKVVMTDTLPAGVRVTAYTLNGWTCTPPPPVTGPATIICERTYTAAQPLPVNGFTPIVELRAVATTTGSLVNRMTVSTEGANFPDPNLANNTATTTTNVTNPAAVADISVAKTAARATMPSGEVQTFRIELANAGPSAAASVTLNDTLDGLINNATGPTNAGLVSFVTAPGIATGFACTLTPEGGASGRSGRLSCSVASLPVCTRGVNCPVVTVSVRPGGEAGLRLNTASASTTTTDPNILNNSGSVSYTLTGSADVSVTKNVTPPSPRPEENFTYVVTAKTEADGRSSAANVTITDTLPEGLVFLSATSLAGSCSVTPIANSITAAGNRTVICNLGTIPSGAQQTVSITVRAGPDVVGQTIRNAVSVRSSTPGDTNSSNDSFTLDTPLQNPVVDLQVNKTDSQDPVGIGGTVDYAITVTNNGPSPARNVTVTDTLPATALAYVSTSIPSDGSCTTVPAAGAVGGTLQCGFPLLNAGESRVLKVTMEGVAKGLVDNAVVVASRESAAGFDSNISNNSAQERTTVTTRVDLAVSKAAQVPEVIPNQNFFFTITLVNRREGKLTEAEGAQITDQLPAGMELTAAPTAVLTAGTSTLNDCTVAPGGRSFFCSFGTMSSGAVASINVPVRVTTLENLPQIFTNRVKASTTSLDIDDRNDAAEASVAVNPAPNPQLTVKKAFTGSEDLDGSGSVTLNDRLNYTITATNTGNVPLTNVIVTDSRITPGSKTCPTVAPGATCVLTGSLIVTPADVTAGQVVNTATADSDETPPVQDTITVAVVDPRLAIKKAFTGSEDLDGSGSVTLDDRLNYTITATNTGNVQLTNVVVTDSRITPGSKTCPAVAPGATCVLTGSLIVTPADVTAGQVVNTATADSNETPPVQDTITVAVGDPRLSIDKVFTGSEDLDGSGGVTLNDRLNYTITATNTGNVPLTNVIVSDSRITPGSETCAAVAPGSTCVLVGSLIVTPADVTAGQVVNTATADSNETPPVQDTLTVAVGDPRLSIDKVFTGSEDLDGSGGVTLDDRLNYTITATNIGNVPLTDVVVTDSRITPGSKTCPTVAPGSNCVLTGSLTVTSSDVTAGQVVNTATADSNETPPVQDTITVPVVKPSDKTTLSKTALLTTVKRGERVPYVILAQGVSFSPARIVDIMPPGFAYDEGSARANGKSVAPSVEGRSLTFDGLVPVKGQIKLELTLVATTTAAVGSNVNQAQLINPATNAVVAAARARVTIIEEAVFDCSDVIGKVFDDRNRNGYQDEGEPGLPGVRLATVRGLLITTDPYGRFSIACADIPDIDIGSNFIVKLDVRTLPTGYRVTTENPRRARLTRGKVVKLNFGAAINRLVKLDLNDKVFEPDAARLKPKWQAGLDRLVGALGAEPSSLRITYVGENGELARARLKFVTGEIERRWEKAGGSYRLPIETRIVPGSGRAAK